MAGKTNKTLGAKNAAAPGTTHRLCKIAPHIVIDALYDIRIFFIIIVIFIIIYPYSLWKHQDQLYAASEGNINSSLFKIKGRHLIIRYTPLITNTIWLCILCFVLILAI